MVKTFETQWFASVEELQLVDTGRKVSWALHEGEFDLPCPAEVLEATMAALSRGMTRYDSLQGLLSLRERICANALEAEGQRLCPDQVLISNGSSQAIFELLQCMVEPGDRVLIPRPGWKQYEAAIHIAGGTSTHYWCTGHDLNLVELERLAAQGAKLLVINSPHNPTGAVLTPDALRGVFSIADRYGLFVLSDEAYMGLAFPGVECAAAWSQCDFSVGNLVVARTFSKGFSMTGFRVGYIVGPKKIISQCAALQSTLSDHVCTFSQFGALEAAMLPVEFLRSRAALLKGRMEMADEAMKGIPMMVTPRGGFYFFLDVRNQAGTHYGASEHLSRRLFMERGVRVAPGEAFGMPGYFRVSIASESNDRIHHGLAELSDFVRLDCETVGVVRGNG